MVLLAIADFAHDNGVAFPSVPTLARKARLGERHVTRVLKNLEAGGELEVKLNKGPSGVNMYRVLTGMVTGEHHGDAGVPEMVTPASYEPSGTVRGVGRKSTKKDRDSLWESLQSACGFKPEGIGERSLFGKCVNELLALGATPDEVKARASRWPMRYRGATMTPRALLMHWGELSGKGVKDDGLTAYDRSTQEV